jgi:hypothetical protein
MLPSVDLLQWLRELPSRRALHTLKEIAALLRRHRELGWDGRLAHVALRLHAAEEERRPIETVGLMQEILGFFVPPASLKEVYLSHEAGHRIKPEDVPAVNALLGALRTQLLLSAMQSIARVRWTARKG